MATAVLSVHCSRNSSLILLEEELAKFGRCAFRFAALQEFAIVTEAM